MIAREVMAPNPVALDRNTPLSEVVNRMTDAKVGAVVVCEGATPIGMFSERDLMARVVAKGLSAANLRLGDVATLEIYVAQAGDPIDGVFEKMRYLGIRHVPIVDQGALVGMVSVRDLLTAREKPAYRIEVGSWMSSSPLVVSPGTGVDETIALMASASSDFAVVVDDGAPVGIFTERDLLTRIHVARRPTVGLTVAEVMSPHPSTIDVHEDHEAVLGKMLELKVQHLPVVSGGKLVGMASVRELMHLRERVLERVLVDRDELVRRYQELLVQSHGERIQHLLYETERFRSEAITDPLTGLFNYRYFRARLAEEFERAKRFGRVLSVAILDVDDFKQVNDTRGHTAGDEVLVDVANLMTASLSVFDVRASLRRTDLLARYGGEEFVIIMPETDAAGGQIACERVRKAIESFSFLTRRAEEPLRLTASFGLACFPAQAQSQDDLLERADEALYAAKRGGKNRTVVAPAVMRAE